ncbi:MAG: hypothetical protein ACKVOR_14280 [Flavobacteriales bacterium]
MKKKKIIVNSLFLFCAALLLLSQHTNAQSLFHKKATHLRAASHLLWEDEEVEEDTIRGLSFGLNLGGYFASKKTANFYNGVGNSGTDIGQNEVRYYSIEEVLNLTLQRTQQIQNFYQATAFSLPSDAYPLNVRYMPAFMVGLQLKFNFNRYSALLMNVNGIQLKTADQFTIQFIGTGQQQNAQNDVRLFSISGKEQRFNANLGYRWGSYMNDMANFYMQFGGSMLGTKVQGVEVYVADETYQLFIGASNPNQIQTYQQRTDIGFGGYVAAGFEVWFNGGYTADLSFGFSRDKVRVLYIEENVWNKWLQLSVSI